jgi:hypothetical protein
VVHKPCLFAIETFLVVERNVKHLIKKYALELNITLKQSYAHRFGGIRKAHDTDRADIIVICVQRCDQP